jgi:hypothetical protein
VVLGRNEEENKILTSLTGLSRYLVTPANFRGPAALISGDVAPEDLTATGQIMAAYSQEINEQYDFNVKDYLPCAFFSVTTKLGWKECEAWRIDGEAD